MSCIRAIVLHHRGPQRRSVLFGGISASDDAPVPLPAELLKVGDELRVREHPPEGVAARNVPSQHAGEVLHASDGVLLSETSAEGGENTCLVGRENGAHGARLAALLAVAGQGSLPADPERARALLRSTRTGHVSEIC